MLQGMWKLRLFANYLKSVILQNAKAFSELLDSSFLKLDVLVLGVGRIASPGSERLKLDEVKDTRHTVPGRVGSWEFSTKSQIHPPTLPDRL